jgi:hypothetical protein
LRSSVPTPGQQKAQAQQAGRQQQQQQHWYGTDPGATLDQGAEQPQELSPLPQSPTPSTERLIVPTWGMSLPRPLQAMSVPLKGLALSPSSSQDLLPSMPSLSDPTVSAVHTPQNPAAEGRLQGAVAQQQASLAAQLRRGGAGSRGQAGTGSSRSCAGLSCSGAAAGVAALGAVHASTAKQQKADSHAAAKAQMDLAAVLEPGTAAASGTAAVPRLVPTGAAAAPAAAAATATAAGHHAAAHMPVVRPIGTCLPAAPWAPAGAAGAATASSLLYGAAPACPLPTNALYKSPLQHVTLSVKVSSQHLSLGQELVHCCVVGSMPLPGTPLPSAQAYIMMM